MCLDTITKTKLMKKEKHGFGFKVVSDKIPYHLSYYTVDNGFGISSTGEWIRDPCKEIIASDQRTKKRLLYKKYKTGFHIWKILKGAKHWAVDYGDCAIIQIEYDDAHTIGTQKKHKVIVARKIRFVKEIGG